MGVPLEMSRPGNEREIVADNYMAEGGIYYDIYTRGVSEEE